MLGSHPSVYTLPETHYFRKLRGRLGRLGSLGLVSPRAARAAQVELIRATNGVPKVAAGWPFVGSYGRAFVSLLDAAAAGSGKSVWVEKSPLHLHYIDEITRFAPDAVFLHIVRDGRDVVTSLLALSQTDPTRWIPQLVPDLRPRDVASLPVTVNLVEAAVRRWNRDVAETRRRRNNPLHALIIYEDLIADPATALAAVCAAIGIPFHESMLSHWNVAGEVTGGRAGLAHMEAVFGALRPPTHRAFLELAPDTQRYIVSHLAGHGDVRAALDAEF
jgi:hypothetical protein